MNLINDDCLNAMATIAENSVDTVITDPPYGLGFMGKEWDTFKSNRIEKVAKGYKKTKIKKDVRKSPLKGINSNAAAAGLYDQSLQGHIGFQEWFRPIFKELLRVTKPGGNLLCFGSPRLYHRVACACEEAGWILKDCIMWLYGSGFPKSYNIGKNLDKYLKTGNASWNGTGDSSNGALGYAKLQHGQGYRPNDYSNKHQNKTEITEDRAKKWEGWGTALKPAYEPIIVAQKPNDGTYANNALKWGVSGLNIDGGRVRGRYKWRASNSKEKGDIFKNGSFGDKPHPQGRFPANIIHDGSDEVVGLFPDTKSGNLNSGHKRGDGTGNSFMGGGGTIKGNYGGDSGSAARFFKSISLDNECSLCYNTLHKDTNKEETWKSKSARSAKESSGSISQTTESIAQKNATQKLNDKSVQLVKYVGNLCDSCGTDIVQGLVAISESQKDVQSQEASQVIQDFIGNYRKCILIQNLANYVEQMDSIDTTQTTQNLLKLFGYVLPAIKNYIRKTEKSEPKRFLYQAKASKKERNEGCEGLEDKKYKMHRPPDSDPEKTPMVNKNNHPTVKPLKLMEYLCTLTKTPTGGVVLDPFMGAGTTGIACVNTDRDFIGIEKESEYFKIAQRRINDIQNNRNMKKNWQRIL